MKIRSSHIVFVLFVLVAGSIAAIVLRSNKPIRDDDAFLESVRGTAVQTPQPPAAQQTGSLPGTTANEDEVPMLVPETTEFHMGTIPNNKPTDKSMKLYNRGKVAVKISDIKTTCGCTVGTVGPDTEIPPGGEKDLSIIVDPWRVPGFHSVKTLSIYSNDPVHDIIKINVTADIEKEFDVQPEEIDLGQVTKGSAVEHTLHIAQLQDLEVPLEITTASVFPADSGIDTVVTKLPEASWAAPGKPEYDLVLKVTPEASVGPINGAVTINTNQNRVKFTRVPLKGEITSFYAVAIHLDKLRKLEPGDFAQGVYVFSATRPVEIDRLETPYGDIEATAREGTDPNTVYVDVAVAPEAERGLRAGRIVAHVKSEGESVVENLPLRAVIGRPGAGELETVPIDDPGAATDHSEIPQE